MNSAPRRISLMVGAVHRYTSAVARIVAPSNKALKLTSLASLDGLGSQLNAVLSGPDACV